MKPLVKVVAPLGVVTCTFFEPRVPAGVVTVTEVELSTTIEEPATPPNKTWEVEPRYVPVILTDVPPTVLPVEAATLEMFGARVIALARKGLSLEEVGNVEDVRVKLFAEESLKKLLEP